MSYPFLKLVIVVALLAGALQLVRARYPRLDRRIRTLLGSDDETQVPAMGAMLRSGWFLLGCGVVCIALGLLEHMRSYYFCQDDVRVAELPSMLYGCRSLWQGHFPAYNPYVLMGTPLASLGYESLTYPPTLLAYAIARHVLHNEYALADVFAILHILAGYIVTYLLARRLRIGAMPATLAALSFVLSGSILMMGRSWHDFIPVVVCMPLLVLGALTLIQNPLSWRSTLGTALVIGLFFQVGFSQIWIYGMALFCLLVPLFCLQEGKPLRSALQALPALLIGIGLSAPLALQQFLMTQNSNRPFGYGEGIRHGFLAMLLPYPFVKAAHPNGWGNVDVAYMGSFFFFGGLFAFLLIVHLVLLVSSRPDRKLWRAQALFVCSVLVFAFALGKPGPWSLLLKLPILGKINNYPFRLLPYFVLFAVLCGSLLLERLLRLVRTLATRSFWEAGIGIAAIGILLYHVSLVRPAFYIYGFTPYPKLPIEMRHILLPEHSTDQERVAAWPVMRSISSGYGLTMNHELASIYQVPCFNGYDPVIADGPMFIAALQKFQKQPIAAARAYGLQWHIDETTPYTDPSDALTYNEHNASFESQKEALAPDRLPITLTIGDITITKLSDVDPLAFPLTDRTHRLPIQLHAQGIDVDVSNLQGSVPAGAKSLTVRYEPPWGKGVLLGGFFTLLGIGLMMALGRITAMSQQDPVLESELAPQ